MLLLKKIIAYFKAKKIKENSYTDTHIQGGITHHLFFEDPSGETEGCGCDICLMRHQLYKIKVAKESIKYHLSLYKQAKELHENLIIKNKEADINNISFWQMHPRFLNYSILGFNNPKVQEMVINLEARLYELRDENYRYSTRYHYLKRKCQV